MLVAPVLLMLIGLFDGSNAKLLGAEIALSFVVQSVVSSSSMKASLKLWPTYSGYSSERNRKSIDRQLAFAGTARSTLRTLMSNAVLPRAADDPPSSAPELAEVFAVDARPASPEVMM